MKPTVILVNPKMCSPRSVRLPLSLLALGAVLEDRFDFEIVDGNIDPHAINTVLDLVDSRSEIAAVGITVMPGQQVAPAIAVSTAIRAAHPSIPIVWGGFSPTLYPDSAINAPYVDFVVRGQGEHTLLELLQHLPDSGPPSSAAGGNCMTSVTDDSAISDIRGLTWKRDGEIIHNPDRPLSPPDSFPPFPYRRLRDVETYLRPSFLGTRTAVHQAAIGCRYRCSFCGVASMFNGHTALQGPDRLALAMETLQRRYGANAVQFYDHNFFDDQETSIEALRVMARFGMPWWCYARTDTLAKFSSEDWDMVRRSGLRMAYLGAEAASDNLLKSMKKGSRVEHTLEVARRSREYGVIPEFSFILGGPEDPEGEIEKTFRFIKRLKTINPECEIILYFYSPTPQRDRSTERAEATRSRIPILRNYGPDGPPLPTTPEEWTQQRWIDYICHQDAPWLTPRIRRRVQGFAQVLSCRFPTVQDHSTPSWAKSALRGLALWRYAGERWDNPWELDLARRAIPLREPQNEGL